MVNKECFYHGFMLGMIACFSHPRYRVVSNRESEYGRFELAIIPKEKGLSGVIMEFKYASDAAQLSLMAKKAIAQIKERSYETKLQAEGVTKLWLYGIAFHGKEIVVEAEALPI